MITFSYLRKSAIPARGMQIAVIAIALSSAMAMGQFQGPPPNELVPTTHPVEGTEVPANVSTVSLLPGDLFQIQIFDVPKFDFKGRLDERGNVNLPLVGSLHLGGLSLSNAEHLIEKTLRERQMIIDPHVILTVIESPNHFATVTGEVKKPGSVPIYGDKHLLDVLTEAGGLTPASSPLISIYHRNQADPVQIHLSSDAADQTRTNVSILPGDTIVVPRVGVVYVVGAVHTQGAIPLKNTTPLTLVEALSVAGGVNFEAAQRKAYLVRLTPEGRIVMEYNLGHIMKQKVSDIVLKNDDIVLVPTNSMKAALKGGAASVAASLVVGIGYISVL